MQPKTPKKPSVTAKARRHAGQVAVRLAELYPEPICTLDYAQPYELLFNTRLAAQCTDARVNLVTPALYSAYPTLEAIAAADVTDVERLVHSCGFYRQKASDIVNAAALMLSRHNGRVPDTMEELLALPGIGRKTANLVLGELYGKPAAVVDTHCIRLTNRLGLCAVKDPLQIEGRLHGLLPPEMLLHTCHRFVSHGRAVCTARSPRCGECGLGELCGYKDKENKSLA